MNCILKEFQELKDASAYINQAMVIYDSQIIHMQVTPFQFEPCVTNYLVEIYLTKVEKVK